ncbi:MAG: 50S ribosome-binding GTPase [Rhodocyclaceae bacterium]|jgi:sulfate adenylyltransferase subunit 1|nr:50S ribosome-binding GTPase [Rhodocyclaceae bacterium]MCA3024608.1 50S ribosome-binding GTPase [Rhodocyclaceae bacterium]MCA3032154.1 50S ribosome-binding GTPase [Rhodocyclaceae bacterium]MCA3037385.1 50S ribosome-binding GTPase [Rhodocyclaceae bacterium]MCA3041357.1 50S ribosome-binding GTPase [Rhodocyclaceae bacterium]
MSAEVTPLTTSIDTLRFSTAGSVDDGKSTLIGRLLFDAQAILEDQLATLKGATIKHGHVDTGEPIDFSLLTDGLIAEREQGITIDVAYRYFATPKRRFIIADTPGHEQYTRNMVTGASTAHLTIILVDATRGLTIQSRRHAAIAGLLKIPHVVVAINKMDLVGYAEDVFVRLRDEFAPFLAQLGFVEVTFIPVSALKGEMLANRGEAMPWFTGPTLLETLETTQAHQAVEQPFRFSVQRVARSKFGEKSNLRGYQGRLDGGAITVGEDVTILPSMLEAKIHSIQTYAGPITRANAGEVVTLVLDQQIDVSRGDMLVKHGSGADGLGAMPVVADRFAADLCWLDTTPIDLNRRYWIKHTTRSTRAVVESIEYRLNVETLEETVETFPKIQVNDIARVTVACQQPLVFDAYTDNRATGCFILIDDTTNRTVAAGMIQGLGK